MVNTPRPPRFLPGGCSARRLTEGPLLHQIPVIDRLSRLYLYTLVFVGLGPTMIGAIRRYGEHAPTLFTRLAGRVAPEYPYIFDTWLRYPEAFEDLNHVATRQFIREIPEHLSTWELQRTLDTLFSGGSLISPLPGRIYRDCRILELPGSAGRYTGLFSLMWPHLDAVKSSTVVCRNEREYVEAPVERCVAGLYFLLAGAGPRTAPRIVDSVPKHGSYDVIIANQHLLGPEADESFQNLLALAGEILINDLDPLHVPHSVLTGA